MVVVWYQPEDAVERIAEALMLLRLRISYPGPCDECFLSKGPSLWSKPDKLFSQSKHAFYSFVAREDRKMSWSDMIGSHRSRDAPSLLPAGDVRKE